MPRLLVRQLAVAAALAATATAPLAAAPEPEQRFGAWGLTCMSAAPDSRSQTCVLSQVVRVGRDGGGIVLGVTIDHFDSSAIPTIHFRFTAEADRRAGIGIKIGQRPEMRLPIADCDARRCEAAGRLSGDALSIFRSGEAAQVAFIGPGGRQVTAPLSLADLSAALEALRLRQPALTQPSPTQKAPPGASDRGG